MFSSIRQRLIITYLILLLIVIIPLSIILQHYLENVYLDTLKSNLQEQGLIIRAILSPEDFDEKRKKNIIQKVDNLTKVVSSRITVIDSTGKVLLDSRKDSKTMDSHINRPEIQKALQGQIGTEARYSETLGKKMFYLALPVNKGPEVVGVVRVSVPSTTLEESNKQLTKIIFLISSVFFLFGVGFSIKMANKVTNPIEKINYVAKKISDGKFDERVNLESYDEIGQLSSTINRMAQTIQTKIEESNETNNRLQSILNSLESGVVLFNTDGKIQLMNPATTRILNKKTSEALNKTLIEVLRHPELDDKFKKAIATKETVKTQFSLVYPYNKTIQVTFSPIFEGQEILNIIGVFYDITPIKEVEKIRTQFVANASHELKTPLTAVKGFTETLLDGAMHQPDAAEKFLKIIYKEADRLQKIIDGLLNLSLLESETHDFIFVSLDLSTILKDIVDNMQSRVFEAELTLRESLPPRNIKVLGDPALLPQVFYNLIGNAIKYTPVGGIIKVDLIETFNNVKVTIEDTGIGIPEEDLGRIFERFYRVDKARSRAKGGTGLGLSIVKHIVDAHSGIIDVESQLGKGTKFIITLPKG